MTVPPCLARDAAELLLPTEVIEKDAARKSETLLESLISARLK